MGENITNIYLWLLMVKLTFHLPRLFIVSFFTILLLVIYQYLYFILLHTHPSEIRQIQWIQQNFETEKLEWILQVFHYPKNLLFTLRTFFKCSRKS